MSRRALIKSPKRICEGDRERTKENQMKRGNVIENWLNSIQFNKLASLTASTAMQQSDRISSSFPCHVPMDSLMLQVRKFAWS
mmetsp:Transcript_44753/g.108524  ORF Transcript_44753/g.108524 Transcript_44753/m.108524 type:complete len:83 (+) Transcript_44753:589-837(+)